MKCTTTHLGHRAAFSIHLFISLPVLGLSAIGCDAGDEGGDGETAGETGDTGTVADVPSNAADLQAFLDAGDYSGFAAESAVHASTGTSPHGMVRVFINETLDQSLTAGNTSHPIGSAAIKELYGDDGTTRIGWAVSVKTADDSGDGMGWYWFRSADGMVTHESNGNADCTACHAPGVDYFTSSYPLQ
jgi:hypothetical protein